MATNPEFKLPDVINVIETYRYASLSGISGSGFATNSNLYTSGYIMNSDFVSSGFATSASIAASGYVRQAHLLASGFLDSTPRQLESQLHLYGNAGINNIIVLGPSGSSH